MSSDSSTELLINLIVIFLILVSYAIPYFLRAKRRKMQRGQRPEEGEGKAKAEAEDTWKSIESIFGLEKQREEEVSWAPEQEQAADTRKNEALQLDADADAALLEAHALTTEIAGDASLAGLLPRFRSLIIEPLEEIRRTAHAVMQDPVSPQADVFFTIRGHASVVETRFLLKAFGEIARRRNAEDVDHAALPSKRIAEDFFERLRYMMQDVFPDVSSFRPVALPAHALSGSFQDEKIAGAGLLLYPAYTQPVPHPAYLASVPFYVAANLLRAFLDEELLFQYGLRDQPLDNATTLCADYLCTSILGPSYLAAMQVLEGGLLPPHRQEIIRMALKDNFLLGSFFEIVPRERAEPSPAVASRIEAVLSLPVFGTPSTGSVSARSWLQYDMDEMRKAEKSIRSPAPETARISPFILLSGAVSAAVAHPASAATAASNLEDVLRGRLPTSPRAAAEPGREEWDITSSLSVGDIVEAIVLGAVISPSRTRHL